MVFVASLVGVSIAILLPLLSLRLLPPPLELHFSSLPVGMGTAIARISMTFYIRPLCIAIDNLKAQITLLAKNAVLVSESQITAHS